MKKFLLITMVVILILYVAITTTSFATDTNVEDTLTDGTNAIEEDTTENDDTDQSNENTETNEIEWTDVSNVTFSLTTDDNGRLYIKINNFNPKTDGQYYIYMSNSIESLEDSDVSTWNSTGTDYENIRLLKEKEIVEKNGPIYIWLAEKIYDSNLHEPVYKILIESQEVSRPAQHVLGNRLAAYFFDDETSTHCFEVISDEREENAKINYKIGTITDTDILRSIQRGDSDCLEKLMEYAKSAKNGKTGSVKLGKDNSITNSLGLVDGAYYYVYMELDDGNGEYYPIEDVSLYQACISEYIGTNLFDYLSDEFTWNLANNTEDTTPNDDDNKNNSNKDDGKDDTTASGNIPQTGATITLVAVFAIVAIIGTIVFIKFRKMRDIK